MVEPLSLLAGAVTTYIIPKALEKVGEKVGEAALAKSGEAIQATRKVVQAKLKSTHTDGVLGQTHTKVHISISTNFGRFIANGLINQSLLRKRLTALALCKSGLCYS